MDKRMSRVERAVVGTVLAVSAAASVAGAYGMLNLMADKAESSQVGTTVILPCATEDSTGCYWDAHTRGNGIGRDVLSIPPLHCDADATITVESDEVSTWAYCDG